MAIPLRSKPPPRGQRSPLFGADAILDSISQAIVATDAEGTVVFCNRPAEELYGWSAATVVGRPLHEIMPADGPWAEPSMLFNELRAGRSWSGTGHVAKNAKTVLQRASAIRNGGAEVSGFVIVSTPLDGFDLPGIGESAKLHQSRLLQAERVSSLGRLAASVAHEFNNILMGIQPFVDLLTRRAGAEPTVKLAAPRIADAVARGKRITQEILQFNRIAEPSRVPVGVTEWLRAFEPELTQLAGAKVAVTIETEPSLTMLADVNQLRQVFSNIVINAHHAMPHGGRLEVRAAGDTIRDGNDRPIDAVHFTIRDTGVGMEQETLRYIFEPLFTMKKAGGTGLGLAVASQIVLQHQGHIDVESAPGEGTTFHILIPASAAPVAEAREKAPLPHSHSLRPGLHVTLVEDDDSVGEGLSAILDMEGISVDWVRLGAEAVARIAARTPDAVIFDLGLPDVDGSKLYKEIAIRWPELPVIFSTGRGDGKVLKNIRGGRHVGYLQKPYDSDALLAALKEVLA